jgi:hypothetical protein
MPWNHDWPEMKANLSQDIFPSMTRQANMKRRGGVANPGYICMFYTW